MPHTSILGHAISNLVLFHVIPGVVQPSFINRYSADFFILFILTLSFCLGITRKVSILLFDLFHFFLFKKGQNPNPADVNVSGRPREPMTVAKHLHNAYRRVITSHREFYIARV